MIRAKKENIITEEIKIIRMLLQGKPNKQVYIGKSTAHKETETTILRPCAMLEKTQKNALLAESSSFSFKGIYQE